MASRFNSVPNQPVTDSRRKIKAKPKSESKSTEKGTDSSLAPPKDMTTKSTKFKISVKTLTGKTMLLAVSLNDTVEELKLQIMELEGIPPDQNRLVYAGNKLENDQVLAKYGISSGSVLHLVRRLRGGCAKCVVIIDLPRKLVFLMHWHTFGAHMKPIILSTPIFTNFFYLKKEVSDSDNFSMEFSEKPSAGSTIFGTELATKLIEFRLLSEAHGSGWTFVTCNILQDVLNSAPTLYLILSTLPPSQMVCLSFATGNRLQLFGHGSLLRDGIQSILAGSYSVTDQFFDGNLEQSGISFTQWQLDSKWDDQAMTEILRKSMFLLNVLDELKTAGFRMHASIANNQKSIELFFIELVDQQEQQHWRNSQLSMMTLFGNSGIRIFGYDPNMIQEIRKAIEECWEPGLKSHGELQLNGNYGNIKVWEFELNGLPWWKNSQYSRRAPMLLIEIFNRLSKSGFVIESAFNFDVGNRQKPVFLFSRRETNCFQFLGLGTRSTSVTAYGATKKIIDIIKETKSGTFGYQRLTTNRDKKVVTDIGAGITISLPSDAAEDKVHKFYSMVLSRMILSEDRVIGSVCLTNLLDDVRKNEYVGGSSIKEFGDETIFVAFSRKSAAQWFDDEP